jgi:hypothetical protein
MPDRLAKLLKELDSVEGHGVEDKAAEKGERNPKPARKHIRKR